MTAFYFSLILGGGAVAFVYTKMGSRRGIDGNQLLKLMAIVFIVATIVSFTILKFFLNIK